MQEVTFTVYANKTARRGKPVTQSWGEWVVDLIEHERRESKDGPAIIAGVVPEDKRRGKNNVECAHAIGLDIEKKTDEQLVAVFDALAPFEYVLYTTHSHTAADPRFRIFVPFDKPVPAADWPDVWAAVNRLVLLANDPATKDVSRLHFLPSCPPGSSPESLHNATGRFLSRTDLDKQDATVETVHMKLRGIRNKEIKPLADALRKGKPYAGEGERHDKTLPLTMWIANKCPPLSHETFSELFAPSVAAMKWDLEEAWVCYSTALEKVEDEEPIVPKEVQKNADLELLNEIAEKHEVKSWTDLTWILQGRGPSYFVLDARGEYVGPWDRASAEAFLRRNLDHVPHIATERHTKQGVKPIPLAEIAARHAQPIARVVADMTVETSTFNDGTLTEVACKRANVTPQWVPEIDRWLQVFAGDQYEKLCNWLASAPYLDRPLCALYIKGPHGTGKSLLGAALAQLWDSTPAELQNVFNNFNASLMRCPIVLGEEAVPKQWKGTSATTRLRAMITEPSRELNRKFIAIGEIFGYIRLILTSNNDELLRSDIHTQEDLRAIAQRFLMITAGDSAREYLLSIKDRDAWRREKLFAAHVMYLAENLPVEKEGRFWVEGNAEEMSLGLMVGSHWNSRVCEWLVRYLMQPERVDRMLQGTIQRRGGELFVNEQALLDHWGQYFPNTREEPETNRIASALRTISQGRARVRHSYRGVPIQYHHIELNSLLLWSDRMGIGDRESIRATVATPTEGVE